MLGCWVIDEQVPFEMFEPDEQTNRIILLFMDVERMGQIHSILPEIPSLDMDKL